MNKSNSNISQTTETTNNPVFIKNGAEVFHRANSEAVDSILNIPVPKQRIYLLRHYPYHEEWNRDSAYTSLDDERMPSSMKQYFEGIFSGMIINPEKTLVVFDEETGKDRSINTARDICSRYGVPEWNIETWATLRWKYDYLRPKFERKFENLHEFDELRKLLLWREDLQEFETIIVVANRSYIDSFKYFSEDKADVNIEQLEKTGYVFCDVDNSFRAIKQKDNQLVLPPQEYTNVCRLFEKKFNNQLQQQREIEYKLSTNPQLYKTYLSHSDSPEELRRYCLYYLLRLGEDETILRHYLSCPKETISSAEKSMFIKHASALKKEDVFIELLVRRKDIWSLEEEVQIEDRINKQASTLHTLLTSISQTANASLKYALDTLVSEKWELLERNLYSYIPLSPSEIEELRKRKQQRGDDTPLSKDEMYQRVSTSLKTLLESSKPSVLLGNVGEGKSTELSRMYNELQTNVDYFDTIPLFYSTKECSSQSAEEIFKKIGNDILTVQSSLSGKHIVVFFDGVDELWRDKDKILGHLMGLHKNTSTANTINSNSEINNESVNQKNTWGNFNISVIMGSRPSGFDVYGDYGFSAIHFDTISEEDREKFLHSRLKAKEITEKNGTKRMLTEEEINSYFQEIEAFLERGILDDALKNTPLVLYFLTELVVNQKDSEWLASIKSRADLYEKMTTKILFDHQGKTKLKDSLWGRWNQPMFFKVLESCAFEMFKRRTSGGVLEEKDINKIIRDAGYSDKETQNALRDQIFLLYKKEGAGYNFILKSFEEYFLARYLANMPGEAGNEAIYALRDKAMLNDEENTGLNWWHWREFKPVVLFYGEILGKKAVEEILLNKCDNDIDLVEQLTHEQIEEYLKDATEADSESLKTLLSFLSEEGLLRNDDMFGENFFMRLEIISKRILHYGSFSKIYKEWVNLSRKINKKWIELEVDDLNILYGLGFLKKDKRRLRLSAQLIKVKSRDKTARKRIENLLFRGVIEDGDVCDDWQIWTSNEFQDDIIKFIKSKKKKEIRIIFETLQTLFKQNWYNLVLSIYKNIISQNVQFLEEHIFQHLYQLLGEWRNDLAKWILKEIARTRSSNTINRLINSITNFIEENKMGNALYILGILIEYWNLALDSNHLKKLKTNVEIYKKQHPDFAIILANFIIKFAVNKSEYIHYAKKYFLEFKETKYYWRSLWLWIDALIGLWEQNEEKLVLALNKIEDINDIYDICRWLAIHQKGHTILWKMIFSGRMKLRETALSIYFDDINELIATKGNQEALFRILTITSRLWWQEANNITEKWINFLFNEKQFLKVKVLWENLLKNKTGNIQEISHQLINKFVSVNELWFMKDICCTYLQQIGYSELIREHLSKMNQRWYFILSAEILCNLIASSGGGNSALDITKETVDYLQINNKWDLVKEILERAAESKSKELILWAMKMIRTDLWININKWNRDRLYLTLEEKQEIKRWYKQLKDYKDWELCKLCSFMEKFDYLMSEDEKERNSYCEVAQIIWVFAKQEDSSVSWFIFDCVLSLIEKHSYGSVVLIYNQLIKYPSENNLKICYIIQELYYNLWIFKIYFNQTDTIRSKETNNEELKRLKISWIYAYIWDIEKSLKKYYFYLQELKKYSNSEQTMVALHKKAFKEFMLTIQHEWPHMLYSFIDTTGFNQEIIKILLRFYSKQSEYGKNLRYLVDKDADIQGEYRISIQKYLSDSLWSILQYITDSQTLSNILKYIDIDDLDNSWVLQFLNELHALPIWIQPPEINQHSNLNSA